MAFNKINLFSVGERAVSSLNISYVFSDPTVSNKDILHHLGTNLQRSNWVNPITTSYLNTSIIVPNYSGSIVPGFLTDRSSTSIPVPDVNSINPIISLSNPLIITYQFLQNFKVDLQAFRYHFLNNNAVWEDFEIQGSNNGVDWENIYSVNNVASSIASNIYYYQSIFDNKKTYYSYIRFYITRLNSNVFRLTNIELYGKIKNDITGLAGFKLPSDKFENLLNVQVYSPFENREIVYDSTEQIWEARVNFPWTVLNLVLNNTLTLTTDNLHNAVFYTLSPNGANRDVILPTIPNKDDTVKIRNLDGGYTITIKENPTDVTPVLLNNANILQAEFVYDGVEWQVS